MTAIELREELFREMNPLLDSETAMKKIIAYVKGLVVAQNKKSGVAPQRLGCCSQKGSCCRRRQTYDSRRI